MAVSILDIPNRNGDLGDRMGQGFSSGVQSGLQNLINWKMQEYTQRENDKRNTQFFKAANPKLTDEQAMGYAKGAANLQPIALKNMYAAPGEESFYELASRMIPDLAQQSQQTPLEQTFQETAPMNNQFSMPADVGMIPGTGMSLSSQHNMLGQKPQMAPGQNQQQQFQQPQQGLAKRLTPQQFKMLTDIQSNLRQEKEKQQQAIEKKQQAAQEEINKVNTPFTKSLHEANSSALTGLNAALAMKKDLESGEVMFGIPELVYNNTPKMFLSQKTQDFDVEANKLVSAKTETQKGQPTGFKIRFNQTTKPSIFMNQQVANDEINRYIEDFSRSLLSEEIANNEIAKNHNKQPEGLANTVAKKINHIEQSGIPFYDALQKFKKNQEQEFLKETEPNQSKPMTEQEVMAKVAGQTPGYKGPGNLMAGESPEGPMGQQATPQKGEPGYAQLVANAPLGQVLKSGVGLATDIINDLIFTPFDLVAAGLNIGSALSGGAIPNVEQVGLPTSATGKEFLGNITGGYTLPSTGGESAVRDWASTIARFALPAGSASKGASVLSKVISPVKAEKAMKFIFPLSGKPMSLAQATILGTGAYGAGKGVKSMGGGPLTQAAAELGATMALGSAGTRSGLVNTMEDSYNNATKALLPKAGDTISSAQKQLVNIKPIENTLSRLKSEVRKSAGPYKDVGVKVVESFETALNEAKDQFGKTISEESGIYKPQQINAALPVDMLPAQDILRLKRNANQWSLLNRIPHYEGQPFLPKETRTLVDRINGAIKEPLEELKSHNLEFGANFDMAEDIYKGLNDLGDASRFLKENVTLASSLKSGATKLALFGGALYKGGLAGAALGVGAAKATRELALLANVLKTDAGKRAYLDSIKAAGKNSVREFTHQAAKLDKIAVQQEKKMSTSQERKMDEVMSRIM